MNFVALIGIVKYVQEARKNEQGWLTIAVEKPFVENNSENWASHINCFDLDKKFDKEFKKLKIQDIVGIKGRLEENGKVNIEKLQIF